MKSIIFLTTYLMLPLNNPVLYRYTPNHPTHFSENTEKLPTSFNRGVNILLFCVHKCAGKISCERKDWEGFLAIKTKFMSRPKKSFPYGLEVVPSI